MKKEFSTNWVRSTQQRKQRKYAANAPKHIKRKLASSTIAKALREKYGVRSLPLRVGDMVRVVRGQFRGTEGKIEHVDAGTSCAHVQNVKMRKHDSTDRFHPVATSNLSIISLYADDKRRLKREVKK